MNESLKLDNLKRAENYIKTEYFKHICLKKIFKRILFFSSIMFSFVIFMCCLTVFFIAGSFPFIHFILLFLISSFSFTGLLFWGECHDFKNKIMGGLENKFLFKDETMSLEEQEQYFETVKSLGIKADFLDLFISKEIERTHFEFGNKFVMLIALNKAIESNKKSHLEVLKSFID